MTSTATSSLRRNGLAFVGLSLAAGACALLFTQGDVQRGLAIGLAAGALSGLFSLAYVVRAAQKGVQAAFLAIVLGMLGRLALVAAALVVAHHDAASMLACAGGFFGLYAAGQMLEIASVGAQARAEERRA